MSTPDQPDGIDPRDYKLPDPARAATRVGEFLSWNGDGLIEVVFDAQYVDTPPPPLYARDLEALRKFYDDGATL